MSSRRAGSHHNGRIAFVTDQNIGVAGLVSLNPGGGRLTMLFASPPDAPPVVSPDGSRLAFVVGDQLEVLRIDGTHRVLIGGGRSPTWSPDGSRLAFVQPETSEIEIAAAEGGTVRDLGVSGSEPVWSPAGDWIAFFSGYSTLELIHPDGSGRTVVATNACPGRHERPGDERHPRGRQRPPFVREHFGSGLVAARRPARVRQQ
jgi:Tol biopolymer transport system component